MLDSSPLASNPVIYLWDWLLQASPERLWPLVSDTNRINALASMAPARFAETPDPDGGSQRTGQAKMLGLGVKWDEHPFEWVYPRGFSVLREFHNGVLKAYRSSVTLEPAGSGTRLVHQVELVPRVGMLSPFVRREGTSQQRNWDHAYRSIDAYLMGDGPWPFTNPARVRPSGAAQQLGSELADARLEHQLFTHVTTEHEHELFHIRPYVLADRWRTTREETLAACLYVMRRKLIEPQWSLLCPHCRGSKGTVARPSELAVQVYCNACNITFGRVSDDVVELTFRPNPAYRRVQEASFCVGGPGAQPHVLFQARLAAGSGRDVSLALPPGSYRLRGPQIKLPCDMAYHAGAVESAGAAEAEELPVFAFDATGFSGAIPYLTGPQLSLRLLNTHGSTLEVLLETRDWREDTLTLATLRKQALVDPQIAELLT